MNQSEIQKNRALIAEYAQIMVKDFQPGVPRSKEQEERLAEIRESLKMTHDQIFDLIPGVLK